MGRNAKYNQEFVNKVHSMKDRWPKHKIAGELKVKAQAITYILEKRKPSVKVEYEKVEQASKRIDTIWKRIKKRFPFLQK